jgi:hypothetical protein
MSTSPAKHRLHARLRSMLLAPADVVEAVYVGEDPAFAASVGVTAIWVVVGHTDEIAKLAPHSQLCESAKHDKARSAPLTDFHSARTITRLLDSLPLRPAESSRP